MDIMLLQVERENEAIAEKVAAKMKGKDEAHRFKVVLLEYDLMEMEEDSMPHSMNEDRWLSLLQLETSEERYCSIYNSNSNSFSNSKFY